MKESKVNNNKYIIIIILVLMVIVIGAGGITGIILKSNSAEEANNRRNEQTQTTVEAEIKDIDQITQLSNKIDSLLQTSSNTEYQASQNFGSYNFRYGVLKNDLTEENKQEIVLESATWKNITGDKWKEYSKIKDIVDADVSLGATEESALAHHKQLSKEEVDKYSVEIFGKKIANPVEEITSCPPYYYDSANEIYYQLEPRCGGAASGSVLIYKSKFIEKGAEAYVYVSVGHLVYDESTSTPQYKIYKDFSYSGTKLIGESVEYLNEYKTENQIINLGNFKLDSTNYQDFSEYKFTFKKDSNDNYYFVDVMQTK